ncbi:hypothetical protein HMH01_12070 [Halovulum dunhuangense]|uniref:Membrane protein YjdF n=1 Tax=Halovulum dunhuangense TaxID=1505036 RepID=A0A849L4Q4_9RHOB|nr:hypothetical protein [Halovulum dunhuangense]NNU81172.1 hypothetical protein [Halovulum dunhuangense]
MRPGLADPIRIVQLIYAVLAVELVVALIESRWSLAFIAMATMGLAAIPHRLASRFAIRLPTSFIAAITVFVFATIFLGEALDFYNRYWWWDVALHGGSAIGFGLVGFLFAFMLFEGDRYAAPPWAIGVIAFCFAVSIGVMWEIFEFAMDSFFGLNMQKSGLPDTMGDLIVDVIGAAIGGLAGFLYLKRLQFGGLTAMIEGFVRANRDWFRKYR